jgi:hypothetical protein
MKRIVGIGDTSWSIGRVHNDIALMLKDDYEFKFYEASRFMLHEFREDFKNSDLCLVIAVVQREVMDMCQLESPDDLKKLVVVAHGVSELSSIVWFDHVTYGILSDVLLPLVPSHVHVVPNGVNDLLFDHIPRSGDLKTLGWCGALWVPFKRTSWVFDIARKSRLPVSIAETLPLDKLKSWYHSIDLLLITSGPNPNDETGPLPPFEAIVSGVPVIGTRVGNFRHVPGPKFETTEEAVEIVHNLRKDPNRLKMLANEQYTWVMANWTYKTLAASWRTMFESALRPRKKILLLCDNVGWAIERVHKDVEAALSREYEFKFHDAARFILQDVMRDLRTSDLCLVTLGLCEAAFDIILPARNPEDLRKFVVVCHGYQELPKTDTWRDEVTYGTVSDVLVSFFPKPVHVVPNGVNLSLFERKAHSGCVKTLGWCGRSRTAFKRSHLASEIARLSGTAISIAETLLLDDLKDWYHTIDVLLVTSGPELYIETGPLPPFEAIASGVLVIGTSVGNFAKVPGPKFTSVEEAAAILFHLKSNPEHVKSLAAEQYKWVVDNWTYRTLAKSWKDMFESAITKSKM